MRSSSLVIARTLDPNYRTGRAKGSGAVKTDALIMSLWISIVSLWVLNVVFFIYALFDFYKSHTSDNKLIPIAFFWFMLNFYATGIFLASGYSTEQSSTVSTNSSPSFARPAFLIISLAGLKGAAL